MNAHSITPAASPATTTLTATSAVGPLRIGSLCTGYGGLDLAVRAVLGGRVIWCADPDRHVATIIAARIPGVPNLGDITGVDFAAVPQVDVLTAGFPCQDISSAGRRAGITEGARSGLWYRVSEAVRQLRPSLLFVENVTALRYRGRGMGVVLGELAQAGYDTVWRCVRASDIGAPHRRERVFLAAWPADQTPADALGLRQPGRLHPGAPDRGAPPRAAHRRGHHLHLHPAELPMPTTQPTGPPTGQPPSGPSRGQRTRGACGGVIDWGEYAPAIERWAAIMGRPAPAPTEPGRAGRLRLHAPFVEWVMGLQAGWVTDVPIPRGAQLHALGNGVLPTQAAHALRLLLPDTAHLTLPESAAGAA